MKLLYIAPDITDSGGISRVISLKANYFVTNFKYEVRILSVNNSYPNSFYDFNPAIKWLNIKKSKYFFPFFKNYIQLIKKTISNEKPDIIIVCDAVLWLFIPWFVKTDIPIIFETHFSLSFGKIKNRNFYTKFKYRLVHFFKKKTINRFTCFVSVTDEGSKEWGAKKSVVIPNPMSFGILKKTDFVNKKAMAVCMNPHIKGLDRLLLIWSRVIQKHSDWILDVYGQWDSNKEYQDMANTLKVLDNVNFLLPTATVQSSYIESSVFLMTSRTEAFGMVLIEAMASGVPCIAYDCPSGPRVIIEDEVNGFLIEDGNSDLFVQKLELLIEDENLRFQMGKAAQESVKKYEIEGIMKRWNKLFLDLI